MDKAVLRAGELTLRPTSADDRAGIIACGRDPEISQMPWFAGFQDGWADDWIARAQSSWEEGGPWTLSVTAAGGAYCGSIAMINSALGLEFAYWMLPQWRDRGYTKQALTAALSWAREHIPARRYWAKTAPGNERSQRVLRTCGFEETARDARRVVFAWRGSVKAAR